MSRRVVVTGMGAVTPIGLNVKDFFASVKAGKHGFGTITRFDSADYKCHVAAELKGFDAKNYMDFKAAKRMEAFSQMAGCVQSGMFGRLRYRKPAGDRKRI